MTHTDTLVRDLQNARQVLAQLGYGRGSYIEEATGQVCLDGALMLATNTGLRTFGHGFFRARSHNSAYDDRLLAARKAVAKLVSSCACTFPAGEPTLEPRPALRVWHWNDVHCDGGEAADALLRETVEKLQASTPNGIPT